MRKATLAELRNLILSPHPDPLIVGLGLAVLTPDDITAMGFRSLTDLIKNGLLEGVGGPDYSTVMRWVRAASVLQGPDDPRQAWGIGRLIEIARCSSLSDRERLLASSQCGRMSVPRLRRMVQEFGAVTRRGPETDEPHAVLRRAIRAYAGQICGRPRGVKVTVRAVHGPEPHVSVAVGACAADSDLAAALSAAGRVTAAIAEAKAAWHPAGPGGPAAVPEPMSLAEIDELEPGQLEAFWRDPEVACIRKAGREILWLPIHRIHRREGRIASPDGSRVVADGSGSVETIRDGCLRAATGLPLCDEPCFTLPDDGVSGCYADHVRAPQGGWRRFSRRYSIISNGLRNAVLRVRLPRSGSPSLSQFAQTRWTVDSESAAGDLSISLGLFQSLAEANPHADFITMCGHQFRPSDEMLSWTAGLRNVCVDTTLSAWFHPDELELRLDAAQRFLDWNIPSVVSIVTHPVWGDGNHRVLDRALALVPADHVFEAPYRHGDHSQEAPLLNLSPPGPWVSRRRRRRDHQY